MMVFNDETMALRVAMMVVALLALTAVNVVRGETSCIDDRDCSSDKYCYNVSHQCVDFTSCYRYNRVEGPTPARQASQCGPCSFGYAEELLGTGVPAGSCKKIMISKGTQTDNSANEGNWSWLWIGVGVLGVLLVLAIFALVMRKCFGTERDGRIFKKMMPWCARPTAPPQDDGVTYRLRGKAGPDDEEQPPIYSSVIGTHLATDNLVNAAPHEPPNWITKPSYDPDYNDNIADGVAIPIHSSSTNLQMDLEEEEETNPSSWTPAQLTVDVPSRPFVGFANEQRDNVLNNVLLRGNCISRRTHDESSSDEGAGNLPEEPSSSRSHGDTFCGPNVQINQTITLNIGKNGTK